jgi:hypothetical protein
VSKWPIVAPLLSCRPPPNITALPETCSESYESRFRAVACRPAQLTAACTELSSLAALPYQADLPLSSRLQLFLHLTVVSFRPTSILLHNDDIYDNHTTSGHNPREISNSCSRFAFYLPFWSGPSQIPDKSIQDDRPLPTGYTIRQVPLSSFVYRCVFSGGACYEKKCTFSFALVIFGFRCSSRTTDHPASDQNGHDGCSSQLGVCRVLSISRVSRAVSL